MDHALVNQTAIYPVAGRIVWLSQMQRTPKKSINKDDLKHGSLSLASFKPPVMLAVGTSTHRRAEAIELTKELIAQSRVIAKGKRIRDVQRLLDQYGGQRSKWVKKSSPVFESEGTLYEYHWYEHYGIGRFETKLKLVAEK